MSDGHGCRRAAGDIRSMTWDGSSDFAAVLLRKLLQFLGGGEGIGAE